MILCLFSCGLYLLLLYSQSSALEVFSELSVKIFNNNFIFFLILNPNISACQNFFKSLDAANSSIIGKNKATA